MHPGDAVEEDPYLDLVPGSGMQCRHIYDALRTVMAVPRSLSRAPPLGAAAVRPVKDDNAGVPVDTLEVQACGAGVRFFLS